MYVSRLIMRSTCLIMFLISYSELERILGEEEQEKDTSDTKRAELEVAEASGIDLFTC